MPVLSEGGSIQVVGRTGSGKTFYAVRCMLADLLGGKVVYSNIQLKWEGVERYAKRMGIPHVPRGNFRFLETEANFHNALVPGASVYLDEAHIAWNARDFRQTDQNQREMLTFLTQARHVKCTVVFITQHEGNVDSQMARVAVYIVRMRNWLQLPMLAFMHSLLGKPKWMERSVASTCDRDGKTVLDRDSFVRSKAIGDCYDTTQLHHAFALNGAPGEAVHGKVKREHPGFVFMTVGLVLLGIWWWLSPSSVPADSSPVPVASAPSRKPSTRQLEPSSVPPPEPVPVPLAGFAAWAAENGERWCTEDESYAFPRFWKAYQSYLVLVGTNHNYRRGDVWRGGKIANYYMESPVSLVLILQRPSNPDGNFYVRLYKYGVRIDNPAGDRGSDGGDFVRGGDGLPVSLLGVAADG